MRNDRRRSSHLTMGILVPVLAGLLLQPLPAQAVQYTTTRYVRINLADSTAYMYDENFVQLPNAPGNPNTSAYYLTGAQWFLGADVDMILRLPDGTLQDVSSNPDYVETNHHFVFEYVTTTRTPTGPCGLHRPLAAGSELTNFHFPPGYGYKMDGGHLEGWNWHWANPGGLPVSDEFYIRFIIYWDDSPTGYIDTNETWIDAVPCTSSFCIPPGASTYSGPDYPISQRLRIVTVVPHVHDHSDSIELRLDGQALHTFLPNNADTPVAHDDCGQGATPYHSHPGHMPAGGLTGWAPGANGPIVQAGQSLSSAGTFNNPHATSIDNMTIMFVFWEPNPSGSLITADYDFDGDVDGIDFGVFASCYNGAGNPPRTNGCTSWQAGYADADDDTDVDGIDFTVFASCYNGAGNPPRWPCN